MDVLDLADFVELVVADLVASDPAPRRVSAADVLKASGGLFPSPRVFVPAVPAGAA